MTCEVDSDKSVLSFFRVGSDQFFDLSHRFVNFFVVRIQLFEFCVNVFGLKVLGKLFKVIDVAVDVWQIFEASFMFILGSIFFFFSLALMYFVSPHWNVVNRGTKDGSNAVVKPLCITDNSLFV